MKYSLDNFAGRYSCLPDVVRWILSPEAFMVFSEIYSHGCRVYNTAIVHGPISIPRRNLQKALGLGRIRIENAVKELIGLELLIVSDSADKKRFYAINWEEIMCANSMLSKLSYDGFEAVRDICKCDNVLCPISKLEAARIKEISKTYQFEWDGPGIMLEEDSEINPVNVPECSKSTQSNEKCAEINPVNDEKCPKSTQSEQKVPKINPVDNKNVLKSTQSNEKCAEINPVRNIWVEKQHQIIENENGELVLNVFLDDAEGILARRIGFSEIKFVSSTGLISSSTGLISSSTGLISSSFSTESESTGLIVNPVNDEKCPKSTQSITKMC